MKPTEIKSNSKSKTNSKSNHPKAKSKVLVKESDPISFLKSEIKDLQEQLEKERKTSDWYKAVNQELIDKQNEETLDFSDPEKAVEKVIKLLCGQKWENIIMFNKQLSANIFIKLKQTLEKQKNQYEFNLRQMEVLKRISEDIFKDEVVYNS